MGLGFYPPTETVYKLCLLVQRKNNNKNLNNLICMENKQKQNPILILIEFSLNFGLKKIYYLVSNRPYIVMVYSINDL